MSQILTALSLTAIAVIAIDAHADRRTIAIKQIGCHLFVPDAPMVQKYCYVVADQTFSVPGCSSDNIYSSIARISP